MLLTYMTDTLIHRFHQCLNPDLLLQLAKDSGWYQRLGKIHPFEFLYSLVFGQLSAVHCTLNAQAQSLTLPVFRQAVDQRYTPAAVAYFQAAFTHTLKLTLEDPSTTPLTQLLQPHFAAVRLFDSTRWRSDKLTHLCSAKPTQRFKAGGDAFSFQVVEGFSVSGAVER